MYFAYGWPKILRVPEADPPSPVSQVLANRDRIIFAVITHSTLSIWTSKVSGIKFHRFETFVVGTSV